MLHSPIVAKNSEQQDQYNRLVVSTVKSLDGLLLAVCDRYGKILSEGHLLIDGYSCRVAEQVFHLALVDRVCVGQAYTVIYIKGE